VETNFVVEDEALPQLLSTFWFSINQFMLDEIEIGWANPTPT
jgi:hypothetical protein